MHTSCKIKNYQKINTTNGLILLTIFVLKLITPGYSFPVLNSKGVSVNEVLLSAGGNRLFTSTPTNTTPLKAKSKDILDHYNDGETNGHLIQKTKTRREILHKCLIIGCLSSMAFSSSSQQANAFPNKISTKYDDRPKRRGPQPKDLNLSARKTMDGEPYIGLKQCGSAPNCFSSTDLLEEDPEHVIPSWKWPKSISTKREAFEQLQTVLKKYEPGQGNIDGGGFEVVKEDWTKGIFTSNLKV